jgi:phosphate transport system permease protein
MNRDLGRQLRNTIAWSVIYGLTGLALVPLGLVLLYTISKGLPAVSHIEFFVNVERPTGIPGGGIANAIVGTGVMVGIASLAAIPIGVISGIYLAEYGSGRWANWVRLASDVLVGAPSIALGLFAYSFLVVPLHHFSGVSASAALAVLMLPVIIRTTESAVGLIPGGLRESGLALGLARWRVSLQLILPAAAPGVITGALLAVARAAGETAPVLFTAFGNPFFSLDASHQMEALTLVVYHNALTPYKDLQQQAWGAALVLVVMVLLINLGSRWVLRRQIRLAGQL